MKYDKKQKQSSRNMQTIFLHEGERKEKLIWRGVKKMWTKENRRHKMNNNGTENIKNYNKGNSAKI